MVIVITTGDYEYYTGVDSDDVPKPIGIGEARRRIRFRGETVIYCDDKDTKEV